MTVSQALTHHFRRFRAHQRSLWSEGGMLSTYPSGRTERTFASAAYGCHALAAFQSARRHIAFKAQLAEDIKTHERRSKAAKKGWKKRRAMA